MHSPKGPAVEGESWVPLEEYPIYIYIYKGKYEHVPPIYGLYNGNFPFNSSKPENDFNMIFQLRNRGNQKQTPPKVFSTSGPLRCRGDRISIQGISTSVVEKRMTHFYSSCES